MMPVVAYREALAAEQARARMRAAASAAHRLCLSRSHRGSDAVLFACARCRRDIDTAVNTPNLWEETTSDRAVRR